jgi:hypothetical protein
MRIFPGAAHRPYKSGGGAIIANKVLMKNRLPALSGSKYQDVDSWAHSHSRINARCTTAR